MVDQTTPGHTTSKLLVVICFVIPVLLGPPLVTAAFVNQSSVSIVRWMLGNDHAGIQAGVFLTRSQRWGQLPPRQAGRVRRFQALAVNPEPTTKVVPGELYERLRVAHQHKDFKQAEAIEQQLVGLQPRYLLDVSASVEAVPGWTLLGYDLDRPMLGPLSNVAITLYWQHDVPLARSPGATQTGQWDWVWVDRRVYQIGQVENLAPNGGFESQLDLENGYTAGWELERLVNGPSAYDGCAVPPSLVVLSQPPNGSSVGQSLEDGSGTCRISSHYIPLPTPGPYLVSAWILVKGDGEACIGNTWWGSIKKAFCASGSRWVHQAKVVLPRPEDDALSLYGEVKGQGTRAFFDDILFFPLDLQALREFDSLRANYHRPSSIARRP